MVLHEGTVPALPDVEERLLEALLAVVVADGDVDPDELSAASRAYAELTGRTLDAEQWRARAAARLASTEPTALPEGLSDGLDEVGRRRVLLAALAIAEADGFVLEEEDELLVRLVAALDLPTTAYREAVEGRLSLAPA